MLYILTAVHNNRKHLESFIESLNHQKTPEEVFLLIVDAGSTDGGAEQAARNCKYVTDIIKTDSEKYWGDCCQIGYKYLAKISEIMSHSYILIINVDTTFDDNYLMRGLLAAAGKTIVVTSGYDKDTGEHVSGLLKVDWAKFSFKVSDHGNICGTVGLFMRMNDFICSGGFCKALHHNWSDLEFVCRLVRRGYILKAPRTLYFKMDCKNTGITQPKNINELFNIKCVQNPFRKSIFILKCCPKKYWPINLARAWYWIWQVKQIQQKKIKVYGNDQDRMD
jgi:GT2 family glycosyltransferase